jgi:hypothetical protein
MKSESNMACQTSGPLSSRAILVFFALLAVAAAPTVSATAATAETPQEHCRQVENDDVLQPIPNALAAVAARLFGIDADYAAKTTYYRCAEGALLLCNVGANLPCGKANTRTESSAANDWCRDHPSAAVIPMAVTGHDTIYEWRCSGGNAKPTTPIAKVDPHGFFLEYWKKVE